MRGAGSTGVPRSITEKEVRGSDLRVEAGSVVNLQSSND